MGCQNEILFQKLMKKNEWKCFRIVVIVVLLFIAALIVCILYRKKNKKKQSGGGQNGNFSGQGKPVIFPNEMDEREKDVQRPLIQKDERPPQPMPEYRHSNGGSLREVETPLLADDEMMPQYQRPPPPPAETGSVWWIYIYSIGFWNYLRKGKGKLFFPLEEEEGMVFSSVTKLGLDFDQFRFFLVLFKIKIKIKIRWI